MQLKEKFEHRPIILLVLGLGLAISYKLFKVYINQLVANDPSITGLIKYQTQQSGYTLFRALASIAGIIIVVKTYKNPREQFKFKQSKWPEFLGAMLVIYFLIKTIFYSGPIRIDSFYYLEAVFNFFTGFSEEFVFRGIIMISLIKLLKKDILAIIISASVFSIWHWDVFNGFWHFIDLGIMGLFFGYAFYAGCSLLNLSLFHFLWDQVYFGFVWGDLSRTTNIGYFITMQVFILTATYIIYKKMGKNPQ